MFTKTKMRFITFLSVRGSSEQEEIEEGVEGGRLLRQRRGQLFGQDGPAGGEADGAEGAHEQEEGGGWRNAHLPVAGKLRT